MIAKKQIWSGGVVAAIGAVAIFEGRRHRIGALTQMEAGYFPVVLGVILIGLGLLIAAAGWRGRSTSGSDEVFTLPDLRGGCAILAGMVVFIGVGATFGLAPATFLSVLISALGDRSGTLRGAFILATIMTAVAIGVFYYTLHVQFPIFEWP